MRARYGASQSGQRVQRVAHELLEVGGRASATAIGYASDGRRSGASGDRVAILTRERGVAQSGSAPGWGPGGRRFKSSRPDQRKARKCGPFALVAGGFKRRRGSTAIQKCPRSSASRAQIGSHPEVAIEQSYQRLRVARDRPDGGVRPLGRLVKKPRREPRTRPPDAGKFLGIQPEARSISLDEPGQAQSFESSPGVLLHVVLARWRALVQSAEPSRARSTC